jgi:hypothetical protein
MKKINKDLRIILSILAGILLFTFSLVNNLFAGGNDLATISDQSDLKDHQADPRFYRSNPFLLESIPGPRIQNNILSEILVETGAQNSCPNETCIIPIAVENFSDVASFRLNLSFNKDVLYCEGYKDLLPELGNNFTVLVDQSSGEIAIQWADIVAHSLSQKTTIMNIVFISKSPGQGELTWLTNPTDCYFKDLQGIDLPAEYYNGEVNI